MLGNNRVKMGRLSELPPGKAIEKKILARRIAVVNDNGTLYGIESECKHMRSSLVTGGVKDGILTCKWHGWKYELATGKCINKPGFDVRRYEIEIDGDDIYLLI